MAANDIPEKDIAGSALPGEVVQPAPHASAGQKIGRFRWVICGLLLLITVNNYMDRQVLSIAAPVISGEFRLSNADIANIANAFLIAYAVGQLFTGIVLDRVGARVGFTVAAAAWSLIAMGTVFSRGLRSFSCFRFMLGAAESVNYPGGVKVCAEWFPPEELATAVGVFQSGSSVGAMLAPIISAILIQHFGWRSAFFVIGLPGLLWIPLWRHFYRPVESNQRVGLPERQFILANRVAPKMRESKPDWKVFLRQRTVWGVVLARFLEEPAAWFYFTWLPLYLRNHRAVPLLKIGMLLLIPFLAFDIGKIGGGAASSLLIRRGSSLNLARKAILLGAAICLMASIPAIYTKTPLGFVLLISIATFGHGCWTTTAQTIPGDIVPPAQVGTVYGITACGGGLGGVVFMEVTGKLADMTGSFAIPLFIAGILPVLGFAVLSLLAPRLEPLED
jgi:MFS transporter, ACS family, hexuronate transporter